MKRWLSILLMVCLMVTLCACGSGEGGGNENGGENSGGETHTHAFGDWTTVTESTCSVAGSQQRVCDCGEKETKALALKAHTEGAWVTDKEATTTETGKKHQVCAVCGANLKEETIPVIEQAHTHSFGDWTVSKAATCTEKGEEQRKCACGQTENREVAAKGHSYYDGSCGICGELKASIGLAYELSDNCEYYVVVGYGTCTDTEVVIPSVYEGIMVRAIEEQAFKNCFSITKVTFGEGIQSIGYEAFSGCISLASVIIPSSLTSFGSSAFDDCDNLKKVEYLGTLEEWCNIDFSGIWYANPCQPGHADLYIGDTRLEVLEIPDSVTKISDVAFSCVDSIKKVIIGDNVTVGSHAFWACQNLVSVEIGENAVLEDSAFYYCKSLVKVVIKEGLTMIPDDALGGAGITEVYLPQSLVFIEMSGLNANTVYFAGSKEKWDSVVIQEYNYYNTVQFNCNF